MLLLLLPRLQAAKTRANTNPSTLTTNSQGPGSLSHQFDLKDSLNELTHTTHNNDTQLHAVAHPVPHTAHTSHTHAKSLIPKTKTCKIN